MPSPETNLGPREPDNDMVICPNCTCQFRAIPVNVQKQLNQKEQNSYEKLHATLTDALTHKDGCMCDVCTLERIRMKIMNAWLEDLTIKDEK